MSKCLWYCCICQATHYFILFSVEEIEKLKEEVRRLKEENEGFQETIFKSMHINYHYCSSVESDQRVNSMARLVITSVCHTYNSTG